MRNRKKLRLRALVYKLGSRLHVMAWSQVSDVRRKVPGMDNLATDTRLLKPEIARIVPEFVDRVGCS